MRAGRIEQDAAPDAVYHRPATPFVAGFMGWHNLFEWRAGVLHGPAGTMPLALEGRTPASHLAWRPEHVPVTPRGDARTGLDGTVRARSYLGERIEYLVDTPLGALRGCGDIAAPWQEGDAVRVLLDPQRAAFI